MAERLGGEIVNADAMQLYRGMDIGTAKLTPAERRGVPHHQLDVLDVTETATVARYQQAAAADVEAIAARGAVPVMVGGSMLYIQSLLDEWAFPATDPAVRARWEHRLAEVGAAGCIRSWPASTPSAAASILPTDGRRIVRALEVVELTGQPFAASRTDDRRAALGHRDHRIGLGHSSLDERLARAHRHDVRRRPGRRGERRCWVADCATASPPRGRWATRRCSRRWTRAGERRRWPRRASARSSAPAATCVGNGRGFAATTASSGSTAQVTTTSKPTLRHMAARILIR